ncbi:MAG TPA: putative porin, partial [Steroidobacteraceae bacterium]
QAQMQALTDRLAKLEATNAQLASQNAELQALVERRDAETDYLKAQAKDLREDTAVANAEIAKVKGADWATKIKARGDFRYRSEFFTNQERVVGSGATAVVDDAQDRWRDRIRARLGFDFLISDTLKGTVLFATGGTDPRSTNQTMATFQSGRQSIGLDMAYVDWTPMTGVDVLLGKQPYPFWRPGTSMFFDGDINPEGGAVRFDRGMLFGSAYGWWLTENYNAAPGSSQASNRINTDSSVFGAQVGLKFALLGGETRVAAHYYDCGGCQDRSPLFNNNANGNTTYRVAGNTTTNWLKYDYNIVELSGEMGLTLFNQPVSLWADYLTNTAPDVKYNDAYAAGVSMGKLGSPKTWLAGVWYQSIGKDSQFGQFVDSDFANGNTDGEGWVLRGGYAPARNFNFTATYFINTLNKDVAPINGVTESGPYHIGDNLNYDRLQVDLNYKF